VIVSFYRQLAEALSAGAVVVATVLQSKGSVPREVGARLFLDSQGNCVGTIGGGAGEAKVIHHAKTVLETGEKQWVEIDLSGAPQRQTQGVCGGFMQVWLERWQGSAAIALVQHLIAQLEAGQPVVLVTPLEQTRSPYLDAAGNGQRAERLASTPDPSPRPQSLAPRLSSSLPPSDSHSLTPSTFTEILQPPPTLLIVGAGHCGIQLAKVADLIGFQVMVQDDRPEWANAQHYPQATKIFTAAIADVDAQLATHTQLYVALITRGYTYDLEALTVLLQRKPPCQYIGMIGSQKRVRQVFQAVEQAGIPAQQLTQVYAPIGLDIGALTPEEIAVSISAELILVRRGGTGLPLSSQ